MAKLKSETVVTSMIDVDVVGFRIERLVKTEQFENLRIGLECRMPESTKISLDDAIDSADKFLRKKIEKLAAKTVSEATYNRDF